MILKFPYRKVALMEPSAFFGTAILKPIIPVMLRHNGQSAKYAALIDSGADFCILHAQIGEYLDIDIRAGQPVAFRGIQSTAGAEGFFHRVTLIIGGWEYHTVVAFSYDIAQDGLGVLGQRGFFDTFVVKFDYQKEGIELKQR